MRTMVSFDEPGPAGTMRRIGRLGYSAACAQLKEQHDSTTSGIATRAPMSKDITSYRFPGFNPSSFAAFPPTIASFCARARDGAPLTNSTGL